MKYTKEQLLGLQIKEGCNTYNILDGGKNGRLKFENPESPGYYYESSSYNSEWINNRIKNGGIKLLTLPSNNNYEIY